MARPLLPREHGAYPEIVLPLAAVLLAGEASGRALLLTLAVLCGFVAHEPVAVLLGRRGERARVEQRGRATRWAAALALIGGAAATAAVYDAGPVLWSTLLGSLVLVLCAVVLFAARLERTAAGEIVVATALASTAIPIGVAAGLAVATSVAMAAVWAVGAALATATVRGIILAAKQTRSWQPEGAIMAAVAVLAVAAVLSMAPWAPMWLPLALCPLALLSVGLGAFRPQPARVRQVGWSFVGANLVTLVILVSGV